ncbi:exopolyphosphatase-like protein [Xylaria sp. FL1042]|nr:exopolyphosphatase-like protein [Xylaria sp. FL1042]KAI0435399.1 exopolyphosphatase-like protein [Xylaria sp. FL1042]
MPPRASLKTFLATARAALSAQPSKRTAPLTFVVGNESADLDSLCSALLLAYFHTYAPPQHGASVKDGYAGLSTLHIPICHLYRADLALRPEFTAVLRDAGIKGEDMFTLEDVLPPHQQETKTKTETKGGEGRGAHFIRPEDTRWLLVDHNAMTGALAKTFGTRVVGCVDHHADEGAIPRDAELRVIEKSGSCASLVLAQCRDVWAALSAEDRNGNGNGDGKGKVGEGGGEDAQIDAQIARLALAPILIDTTNLGDRNKTTEYDERAVALVEAKIVAAEGPDDDASASASGGGVNKEQGKRYNRDALFAHLSALKEDLSEMSFRDVLRKDFKEWNVGGLNLATSSVPRGFAYLMEEKARGDTGEFVEALRGWGEEKDEVEKMDVIMVLTAFQDAEGRFHRELLVWARSQAGVHAAKVFEERYRDTLRLEAWGEGVLDEVDGDEQGEWRRCWEQKAVQYSRKQIAPMLRDALKEVSAGG